MHIYKKWMNNVNILSIINIYHITKKISNEFHSYTLKSFLEMTYSHDEVH